MHCNSGCYDGSERQKVYLKGKNKHIKRNIKNKLQIKYFVTVDCKAAGNSLTANLCLTNAIFLSFLQQVLHAGMTDFK